MDRIATHASHAYVLDTVLAQQQRVRSAEAQVATGKKALDYAGYGLDSARLLDLETTLSRLEGLARNNETVGRRLEIAENSVTAIDESLREFRAALLSVGGNDPLDADHAADLQQAAFRALQDMQAYLNAEVDGRYLFAGSRVNSEPVDLGLTTLDAFQTRFDGDRAVYPPTRNAHISTDLTLGAAVSGGLTINVLAGTITAGTAGVFAQVEVGATIAVAGAPAGNTDRFTVVSKSPDNGTLTISGPLVAGGATIDVSATLVDGVEWATASISVSSWYRGDEVAGTHRVDEARTMALDLTAIDPALEKAIRAAGLIAQGAFGTAGGLADHPERVSQAIDLLNNAIDATPAKTPPFGAEKAGSLDDISYRIGYGRSLLDETSHRQEEFIGQLRIRIAETEDVDMHEAVARLLDESTVLEAAYKAVARVRQLSLVDLL